MYTRLQKADFQKMLGASPEYRVDALIVAGTYLTLKETILLHETLDTIGVEYAEETLAHPFLSGVKVIVANDRRIWFSTAYGTAYLSELTHIASILGSSKNLLLGSCGALQEDLGSGDTILPSFSYGNESSTRMYQRNNLDCQYPSDRALCADIASRIGGRTTINQGRMMTVQAMLAESKEDVDAWSENGYVAVDMESATLFAVSNHFDVPCAALLYVSDNLIRNELVTDSTYGLLKEKRSAVKRENYETVLRVALGL